MGALTAIDLLSGPRGRVLCMAVAHRLDERVWTAWYESAHHLGEPDRRDVLVRTLEAVDPNPVRGWLDPIAFLESVEETVSQAMYWQPAHDEDVAAADPAVIAALRPLAAAIATAPAARWWSSPADLRQLRFTSWPDDDSAGPPTLIGAPDRLREWRDRTVTDNRRAAAERPADAAASWSGQWWSTPALSSLVTTTRPLPRLGSTELVWREDSMGQQDASIWHLGATRPARVWEIDRPDAWTTLVERYPIDVSHARRHDWYRTTGRIGAWRIPDWSAVAADWDAVHLSVAGYLTTATRALPLADGRVATLLGGWNPDQTWWLTDILAVVEPDPDLWHNSEEMGGLDLSWRLVSGT